MSFPIRRAWLRMACESVRWIGMRNWLDTLSGACLRRGLAAVLRSLAKTNFSIRFDTLSRCQRPNRLAQLECRNRIAKTLQVALDCRDHAFQLGDALNRLSNEIGPALNKGSNLPFQTNPNRIDCERTPPSAPKAAQVGGAAACAEGGSCSR